MLKYKLLIIIIMGEVLSSSTTEGGLSFMNIPASAKAGGLMNTLTSTLYSPNALIQNPANIWDSSPLSLAFTHRQNNALQSSYNSIFLSGRSKKFSSLVLGAGFVHYGVDKIESYDSDAVFLDYFNWQDNCALVGISVKSLGVVWGVGANYIFRSTSYDPTYKENYLGLNLGATMEKIHITQEIRLTLSYVMMNTFGKDKDISTSSIPKFILGTMLERNIYAGFMEMTINVHTDMYRSYQPILYFRHGLELMTPLGEVGSIALDFGYGKMPIIKLDTDYLADMDAIRKYSRKMSYGFNIRVNPFNRFSVPEILIGYSSEINYGMNSLNMNHISIDFIQKMK